VLTEESMHPRDDVATIKGKIDELVSDIDELRDEVRHTNAHLRRTEVALADGTAHARDLLTADLARLTEAQAADRAAARSRNEELGRRIDEMVRRIQTTLDGLGDHQELLTGLRALVRMVRSDQG
jgi:chromosome segregation ATPase